MNRCGMGSLRKQPVRNSYKFAGRVHMPFANVKFPEGIVDAERKEDIILRTERSVRTLRSEIVDW